MNGECPDLGQVSDYILIVKKPVRGIVAHEVPPGEFVCCLLDAKQHIAGAWSIQALNLEIMGCSKAF